MAVAAAGALSADLLSGVAVETNGFRFGQLKDYRDALFLPGIVKYGDLPALLALNATHEVLVFDAEPEPSVLKRIFALSPGTIVWNTTNNGEHGTVNMEKAIVDWLLRGK